jgi:hypothetical protein
MSQVIHTIQFTQPSDDRAISIERANMLRAMRRRRVAKRMLKRIPLFAVEEMQQEFPGYDYNGFVADVTRKTRPGKKFRKPKQRAFDWQYIRNEIPDFFQKCITRTKTQAVLRGRKNDVEFTLVIKSIWFDGQCEQRFKTGELINLWRGSIQNLIKHPAVSSYINNNIIQPPETPPASPPHTAQEPAG